MRISIIIKDMHGGGAERVALTLLDSFVQQGHAVHLVLFKKEGLLLSQIPDTVQLSVLDSIPSLFSALNPFSGLRKWLRTAKRWGDTDLLLCFSSKVNRATLLANLFEKAAFPIVITEHNVFSKDISERVFLRRLYVLLMSKWLYKKASMLIAVSDYVRNDIVKLGIIPEEKTEYIYNPIVLKEDLKEDLHPWLQNCTLEVVFAAGSFFRVKDYPTLIKAFALLHKRRAQTRLIILGEGSKNSREQRLVNELGLTDFVDMPGFHSPYQYMSFAKIFVSSSKHEAFSLVVAEALLHGLNVVSTDCGGPSELIDYGKYGWLVPIGDSDALATAMEEAIKNPIPSALLKERGSKFLPEQISSQYLDLISKLIATNKSKSPSISLLPGQKVLWIELGGFGDVAQAISDIKILKDKFPETSFSILTKPEWRSFAESQSCVESVISGNKKPKRTLFSTAKKIRKGNFDWISDISTGGSHSFLLLLLCGKIKRLPVQTEKLREKPTLFLTKEQKEKSERILCKLKGKRVLICPGAGGTHLKMWPAECWRTILEWLISLGYNIVIAGHGEKEVQFVNKITASLPEDKYLSLVNELDTVGIFTVALSCDIAIGNDTGILHLAALGGISSVGIFSYPTSWRVGFRMPWFVEVTATNEFKKFRWEDKRAEYVLNKIKPEKVQKAFKKAIELGNSINQT